MFYDIWNIFEWLDEEVRGAFFIIENPEIVYKVWWILRPSELLITRIVFEVKVEGFIKLVPQTGRTPVWMDQFLCYTLQRYILTLIWGDWVNLRLMHIQFRQILRINELILILVCINKSFWEKLCLITDTSTNRRHHSHYFTFIIGI